MKRYCSLMLVLFLVVSTVNAQDLSNGQESSGNSKGKNFLLDYYQQTFHALKKSTENLSPTQLRFKAAADKWSIGQCLEHIVVTERMLFGLAKEATEKPATPERRSEVKATDEKIIQGINDRSFKAKATEDLTGKNNLSNSADALNELQRDRKLIADYLANVTEEDLRSHISDSPFGPIDAYQSFLFIAGHTSRHTLQIEEIKTDKNFPKK